MRISMFFFNNQLLERILQQHFPFTRIYFPSNLFINFMQDLLSNVIIATSQLTQEQAL